MSSLLLAVNHAGIGYDTSIFESLSWILILFSASYSTSSRWTEGATSDRTCSFVWSGASDGGWIGVCVALFGCSLATRGVFALVTRNRLFFQPNVPCTDNVAFDMERLTRGQPASRRSALGDFANDSSLSLEPLRTSGMSQLPQDGELTPRSGEINIAVTSKFFFGF